MVTLDEKKEYVALAFEDVMELLRLAGDSEKTGDHREFDAYVVAMKERLNHPAAVEAIRTYREERFGQRRGSLENP